MKMSFGFGMNGMEEKISSLALSVGKQFPEEVTYVEIGVGEGTTLTAIAAILATSGVNRWRAIGIDLPNGYSFNEQQTTSIALRRGLSLEFVTPVNSIVRPKWNQVTVYLRNSQSFLTENWQESIHFAMIDGCHGKPCAILDFLALEAFMVSGATMMFHDFGEGQIGQSQPHCPDGVDVRGACRDLGLLNGKRPGWKFADTFSADIAAGGWDMGVFKKD